MTPKITEFNEAIVNAMLVYGMRYITHCVLPLKIHLVRDSRKQEFFFPPHTERKKNRNNSKLLSIGFSNIDTLIQRRFYVRHIPISHGIEISRYFHITYEWNFHKREREIFTCVNYMRRCSCNVCGWMWVC